MLRTDQEATLRGFIRRASLDPRDFDLEHLQGRAEELFDQGCTPVECYSRAIGVDLTPVGYEGPVMASEQRVIVAMSDAALLDFLRRTNRELEDRERTRASTARPSDRRRREGV